MSSSILHLEELMKEKSQNELDLLYFLRLHTPDNVSVEEHNRMKEQWEKKALKLLVGKGIIQDRENLNIDEVWNIAKQSLEKERTIHNSYDDFSFSNRGMSQAMLDHDESNIPHLKLHKCIISSNGSRTVLISRAWHNMNDEEQMRNIDRKYVEITADTPSLSIRISNPEWVSSPSEIASCLQYSDTDRQNIDWQLTIFNLKEYASSRYYDDQMIKCALLNFIKLSNRFRDAEYFMTKSCDEIAKALLKAAAKIDKRVIHRNNLNKLTREVGTPLTETLERASQYLKCLYPAQDADKTREHFMFQALISFTEDPLARHISEQIKAKKVLNEPVNLAYYTELALKIESQQNSEPTRPLQYNRKIDNLDILQMNISAIEDDPLRNYKSGHTAPFVPFQDKTVKKDIPIFVHNRTLSPEENKQVENFQINSSIVKKPQNTNQYCQMLSNDPTTSNHCQNVTHNNTQNYSRNQSNEINRSYNWDNTSNDHNRSNSPFNGNRSANNYPPNNSYDRNKSFSKDNENYSSWNGYDTNRYPSYKQDNNTKPETQNRCPSNDRNNRSSSNNYREKYEPSRHYEQNSRSYNNENRDGNVYRSRQRSNSYNEYNDHTTQNPNRDRQRSFSNDRRPYDQNDRRNDWSNSNNFRKNPSYDRSKNVDSHSRSDSRENYNRKPDQNKMSSNNRRSDDRNNRRNDRSSSNNFRNRPKETDNRYRSNSRDNSNGSSNDRRSRSDQYNTDRSSYNRPASADVHRDYPHCRPGHNCSDTYNPLKSKYCSKCMSPAHHPFNCSSFKRFNPKICSNCQTGNHFPSECGTKIQSIPVNNIRVDELDKQPIHILSKAIVEELSSKIQEDVKTFLKNGN